MKTALRECAKIFRKRGYVVIGSMVPMKVGQIARNIRGGPEVNFDRLGQPARVVRRTTFADFCGQEKAIGHATTNDPEDSWRYFYVVVTD
jgi:hypothetical protein